jgi:hypothetical protein
MFLEAITMKILLFISFLIVNTQKDTKVYVIANDLSPDRIIGKWLSEDKDLKVEIFKKNDHYFGKVVWFACLPETPNMDDFKDTRNSETENGLEWRSSKI